jgi:hypothetical protein
MYRRGGLRCLELLTVKVLLTDGLSADRRGRCRRQAAHDRPAARPGNPPEATQKTAAPQTMQGRPAGRTAADGRRPRRGPRGDSRGRRAERGGATSARPTGRAGAKRPRSHGPRRRPAKRAHQAERWPAAGPFRGPPLCLCGARCAKRQPRRERSEMAGPRVKRARPTFQLSPFSACFFCTL